MDARIIQQQVLIGSNVTFFLKTGQAFSGILTELSRNYVVIESQGKRATISLEMIGAWQVEEEAENQTTDLVLSDSFPNAVSDKPISIEPSIPFATTTSHQDNSNSNGSSSSIISSELAPIETSIASPKKPPKTNGNLAESSKLSESSDPETIRALLAIEAKYEARISFARLDPDGIEFKFPKEEVEKNRHSEAHTAWQNIKSIYDYAVRVHELDQRHGRIGRFAYQLAQFAEQYPETHTFQRQAAHAALLAGQSKNALELWKKVAIATQNPDDWKNVAAIAFQNKDDGACCYALWQYYTKALISEEDGSWFIFINLVKKFSSHKTLQSIVQSKSTLNNEEKNSLLEAGVYLLTNIAGQNIGIAESYIVKTKDTSPSGELLTELFEQFPNKYVESFEQVVVQFEAMARWRELNKNQPRPNPNAQKKRQSNQPSNGCVIFYKDDQNYGFIRGNDGNEYFFHRSSVSDSDLIRVLSENPEGNVQVRFFSGEGERGLFAHNIGIFRSVEDMAKLAFHYAEFTEYQKAAMEIRNLLNLQPDYPNGQDLYAKWHRFATDKKLRANALPKGTGYYARAKCADFIENDHNRAIELYKLAIEQNDRVESAVKDLATVLDEEGRNQEAIEILIEYRDRSRDPRAIDGILTTIYQKTGEIEKAIQLLYKRAKTASDVTKHAQYLFMIAKLHLVKQEFDVAEHTFRQVLITQPENTAAKRNIAICLFKQGRLDEAESILSAILEDSSDAQSAEMLTVIQQSRSGVISTDIDILINVALSDFFTETSALTKFFLDRCDFKGVPPERIHPPQFRRSDVEWMEDRASGISGIPRERSSLYFNAAKIESMLEDSDLNRFYRYLCRSFASLGDAIVKETGMRDSACDIYCEALAVYDNDRSHRKDEQDAMNSIVRFLYATIAATSIPIIITRKHLSLDEAIENVIVQHPNRTYVFHYVSYLIYRSRDAAARILTRLYNSNWKQDALDYLQSQGVEMLEPVKNPDSFARLWDKLRHKHFENYKQISNDFRDFTRVEITTATLENCINRIHSISEHLFFELDQERLREIQRILELMLN